jgi:hypothetical protein
MLVKFLQENRDIFEWKPADMPGVPRELIEHELWTQKPSLSSNDSAILPKIRKV